MSEAEALRKQEVELMWKSQITRQIIDVTKKCFEHCISNPNTNGLLKS